MPFVEWSSGFLAGAISRTLISIEESPCSSFSNGWVAEKKSATSDGDDLYSDARNIGTVTPFPAIRLNLNDSTRAMRSCRPKPSSMRRGKLGRSSDAIEKFISQLFLTPD